MLGLELVPEDPAEAIFTRNIPLKLNTGRKSQIADNIWVVCGYVYVKNLSERDLAGRKVGNSSFIFNLNGSLPPASLVVTSQSHACVSASL
jgi:hypothetical protein